MINNLNKRQFKQLAKQILNWCPYYLGFPLYRANLPKLYINYSIDTHYADWQRLAYRASKITLYPKRINTKKELVKFTIHEYVHFIQFNHWSKDEHYVKLTDIYGYKDNLYEIEARALASKFTPHIYRRITLK
jgi:hypothetical protein